MTLSAPLGNFTIHQLKNLKVGDMGFSALCTYFNEKVWGNTIYGSKDKFEKVFISFVVTDADIKKGEFCLKFDALPEGKNIQVYSLKKVMKDKHFFLKYYFFGADASVLPQGHSVIHSVPDDEVILLPVPKKLKKSADPPENSACNETT